MISFVNPAATLTADRVAIGAGGGRLKDDSRMTWDTVNTCLILGTAGMDGLLRFGDGNTQIRGNNTTLTVETFASRPLLLKTGAIENVRCQNGGLVLFGETVDRTNGRLQIATHTTSGGGIGFYDFSFYRTGAQLARLSAGLTIDGALTVSGAGGLTVAGPHYAGADIFLGSVGNERRIYDYAGNQILRARKGLVPTTLADVITVLQWHGLCQ